MTDTDNSSAGTKQHGANNLDGEWTYDGWRLGRATRTVEVAGPNGPQTIEEGDIGFDFINHEDAWVWREDDWVEHYVAPDGGRGLTGGVVLPRERVGIIEFPRPMTREEAWEWLEDNPEQLRQHLDTEVESDTTAADILGSDLR